MIKGNTLPVFILLLILLAATGCSKEEELPAEPQETEVKSSTVEAFGTVEIKKISNLTLDFPTTIKQLDAQVGQLVSAGQVLAILDLSSFNNSMRQYDFEIQKLQNELQIKQLLYENAKKDLERRRALLEAGVVNAAEYEEYETGSEQVAAEIKGLEILTARTTADRAQLQNQLENKVYLDGSNLISPFAQGLVAEVNCFEGDSINPPRSLMKLMDLESIYIEAVLPEEFIGDIKTNAQVIIVPLADSSKEYHGRVVNIANMAQSRNGETVIPVEITIEDHDPFLKPKYNVDVMIFTD